MLFCIVRELDVSCYRGLVSSSIQHLYQEVIFPFSSIFWNYDIVMMDSVFFFSAKIVLLLEKERLFVTMSKGFSLMGVVVEVVVNFDFVAF